MEHNSSKISQNNSFPDVLKNIVLNNKSDAIALTKINTIIEANDAFARLFGYKDRSEVLGLDGLSFISLKERDIARENIEKRKIGKWSTESRTYEALKKDNTPFKIELSIIPWMLEPEYVLCMIRDVTMREHFIDVLKQSEKLYKSVAEAIPAGIILMNTDGEILYANQHIVELAGCSVEELPEIIFQVYPHNSCLGQKLVKAYSEGKVLSNVKMKITRKDNSIRWVNISMDPIFDENHHLQGSCGVLVDITESKKNEEIIRETEMRYKFLTENMSDCIYQLDSNGRILYLSQSVSRYGYTQNELIGKYLLDYLCKDDREFILQRIKSDVKEEKPQRYKVRIICKDGSFAWLDVSADAVTENGVTRLQGIGRDISEQKQAEDIAKKSDERFRQVLEHSRDMVFQINLRTGKYEYMSPSVKDILGFTPEEFISKGFDVMVKRVHPDDMKARLYDMETIKNGTSGSLSNTMEYRYLHKDGRYIWLSTNRTIISDENGHPASVIGNVRDITNQKIGEQALIESENRYRGLIESQQSMIVRTDKDCKFTFVNDSYCNVFGKTVDQLIGHSFVPLVHKDDIENTLAAMELLKYPPYRATMEQRALTAQGWRWIVWEDDAIVDENGEIVEIQGVGRDITSRRAAEDALRESEARYRAIVEDQTELICRFLDDGTITFANDAYCRYFDKDHENVINESFFASFANCQKKTLVAQLADLNIQNPVVATENPVITPLGHVRWQQWTNRAIFDENGEFIEFQAVGRDITERKRMEEALRRSEEHKRALLNATPDLFFRISSDGIFLDCKEAKEFPLLMPQSDFLGQSLGDVLPKELAKNGIYYLKKTIETGEMQVFEYELAIDGKHYCFEDRFIASGDDEILSIVRDITNKKIAEDAMKKAHADLERLYNLQREFLNNVTHEVRTPLTAVQGYVKMILEGIAGPVNNEQSVLLNKVLTSSDNLLDVVSGVLEIARLKSGSVALGLKAGNLCKIVDRAITSITPQAKQKGLDINFECPKKSIVGMYDESKLTIIITNILANAVKFTEKGSINIFVNNEPDRTEIIIADTGMGIKSTELLNIFDEFKQLDFPRKHKPVGFGLGLAIVASMIDIIGASLTVSSEKDVGTAFTLLVPLENMQ